LSSVEELEFFRKYNKWSDRSPLEKIAVMEKRVIVIRWLGIIVGATTVPFLGLHRIVPMYLLIAYALLHNVMFQFFIIPYRKRWLLKSTMLTIGDIIMASAAVYLTGGLNSDFYLIYFLLAVLSAIRFGRKEAIISTSIATVLYIIVIYKATNHLTSMGIADIALRMGFVVITGIFVGYLGDRTRQIELDLQKELDKAHEQLNKSIALLNQNLELEDVLHKGAEQACHLIDAELSMIVMEETSSKVLAHQFQDALLKPYLSCKRVKDHLSEQDILYFSKVFPELSNSLLAKYNTMYKNKEVTIVNVTANEVMSKSFSLDKGGAYYLIAIPLLSGEKKLGTLYLVKSNNPFKPLRETQVDLVFMYAHSISSAIANSMVYTQSRLQAITDPVTGLYNHRFYQETIKVELDRCLANQKPLSLIVLDIDSFKQFNDLYGHSVGDLALKAVANIIQESINGMGVASRYGGDEFVIILPSVTNKQAFEIAELIRRKVFVCSYIPEHEALASLKVSLGVATAPRSGKTPEELFSAADSSLYIAKYAGNHSVQSDDELSDYEPYTNIPALPKYTESKKMLALQEAFSKISTMDFEMIEAFIVAVDARDHYTYDHSDNVSSYSSRLAQKMNLPSDDVERVRLGALLHDIGKIGIPDSILNKPGKLTGEEFEIVKQHPIIGAKIIQPINSMSVYCRIIMYHHEWFNGNGYPYGLKEGEIPLEARIVSICDAFDAMTTDRPYHRAMPKEKALRVIEEMVGTQFDPEVWVYFNEMITDEIEQKRGETNDGRLALEII
jgi:diguanylate cyclase (GGDEF)-like protein/putative nucleotidyltransferase with HDIG domain